MGRLRDRPGKFIDHFFYAHRAMGCQLAYPCPFRDCPVVLSMPRTLIHHVRRGGIHTDEECEMLSSMSHPYPDQTIKMQVAYFASRELVTC